MYAGYVNGNLLFACGMPGYEIVDGTINEAVGSASSAEIKFPPSNSMRDALTKRSSVISIYKDGTEVFRGCVVGTSAGLRGVRTYNLDGAMMWLADICKPPHTINAMGVSTYLGALVTQYNAGCLEYKQIKMGTVDASLPPITLKADAYMSMLDLAKQAAAASGGILRIRYSGGDVYLDCIKSYNHSCSQTVELHRNLLDLTDQIDGTNLITRVYPVGKDGLTISDVNSGRTYLVNSEAERIYGRIDGTLQVNTDDAYVMKATAASYLAKHCGLSRGIQVSAADLSGSDITMESYHIGDSVRVVSPPHGIDTTMTVSELKTSLVGDKGTMTLGWAGKTLTGAVASGGGGSSGGSAPVSGGVDVSTVLGKVYPVGSIYMSVNSTSPGALFGGTWVQIEDKFLLAAGATYKAGSTGGEATHTLTQGEMPKHNHIIYAPNGGGPDEGAALGFPEVGSSNTWWAAACMTGQTGGSAAHNNMPPYLAVYVWARTA